MFILVVAAFLACGAAAQAEQAWTDECGVSQFEDAGVPPFQDARIVTGWEVRFNELPYQVLIENRTGILAADPVCGGALINNRWVLTSAACVYDLSMETMQVVLGEHRRLSSNPFRVMMDVMEVHIHPDYTPNTEPGKVEYNDIALLRMMEIVPTTLTKYPICRPPTVTFNDTNGIICGWGGEGAGDGPSNPLLCTYLDFVDDADCQLLYPDDPLDADSSFCTFTAGRDVCTVDRGGPISVKIDGLFYILGIASWSPGCSQGPPSVFMDVKYYEDWITSVLLP